MGEDGKDGAVGCGFGGRGWTEGIVLGFSSLVCLHTHTEKSHIVFLYLKSHNVITMMEQRNQWGKSGYRLSY